jgi:hypothetical protein
MNNEILIYTTGHGNDVWMKKLAEDKFQIRKATVETIYVAHFIRHNEEDYQIEIIGFLPLSKRTAFYNFIKKNYGKFVNGAEQLDK